MTYIYSDAEALDGKPLVGNHQCVALVKQYANAPAASLWKEGVKVNNKVTVIAIGTAIATFVDKKYPDASTGNHAALFLSKDKNGIWIVDQWKSPSKKVIGKRHIIGKGSKNGIYIDPSNNADAFSVVQ